jgi:hypothetical protein
VQTSRVEANAAIFILVRGVLHAEGKREQTALVSLSCGRGNEARTSSRSESSSKLADRKMYRRKQLEYTASAVNAKNNGASFG